MPAPYSLLLVSWLVGLALLTTSCDRHPRSTAPLPQRGYLWQRVWTPAVSAGVAEAGQHLQGVVLLGAETRIVEGKLVTQRANVDWAAVQRAGSPAAIALRVAPFPGPFAPDDAVAKSLAALATNLLAEARAHGISPTELQLDFDCAQKKLGGYRAWVHTVRAALAPTPLVLTALPAWLEEPEFAQLVQEVDGYVLQVHSVPMKGGTELCDPSLARAWARRAAKLGRPFSIALPTYRCLAGYAPDGKLLSVAMDAEQPTWPRGTRTLELAASAEALAALVREWQADRPAHLQGLLWYRIPISTDVRNWRWPTFDAVLAGRAPVHRLEVRQEGANPADLVLHNTGETDSPLECTVTVTWKGDAPTAADSLLGWSLHMEPESATYSTSPGAHLRLPPGEKRSIGWLRYEFSTPLRFSVESLPPRSP